MEVSFAQNGSAPVPTPVAEVVSQTESIPAAQTAVATIPVSGVPAKSGILLGDRLPSFAQVILPRLNIVQGIGQLKDTFTPGELVFNQSTVLYTAPKVDPKTGNIIQAGTPPINIYVIGIISERFSEKVEGGFGGMIVDSEEAVRASGGTLDYKEWTLKKASGMKRFENLVDILILIEKPERVKDDDTVFNFAVEGKKYALGAWALKGSAYTEAMKRVFFYNRLAGVLKAGGYPSYQFVVSTRLKPFQGGNSAWIPVCSPTVKTSETLLKFIYELAGSPA